jgi:regulator of sirC expression with transglutaminase-like and TPR domain
MKVQALPENSTEPTAKEKKALLTLLGDEDRHVYETIRTKILSYGFSATRWLQPGTLSNDPAVRRRANEIIQFLSREAADNRFIAFCLKQSEELDVEEGSLLLAETQYPGINSLGYQAMLESYAADLREQIHASAGVENRIAILNHFLFTELGFCGNEEEINDPENSYLNRVMDRRTGNPISLCSIYLFLARRLKLPVVGIGMPGHFLCRYQTTTEELFIDAFNRGKILTKAHCVKYLLDTHDGFKESFLAPITGRRMLLRMCSNLHQAYSQRGSKDEMGRLQRYIVALAR